MTGSPLPEAILNPGAIALVGASTKEGSTGNTTLANILKSRFRGRVYPVNPKADEILGVRAYASVESIPERIDLVLVAVPAPAVPQALAESAAKGAKAAVVLSSGFSEMGEAGKALQTEAVRVAQGTGMRLIGPNCLGIYNVTAGLNFTLSPSIQKMMSQFRPGNIGFVTQSGASGVALLIHAVEQGMAFSHFFSLGNKADVHDVDILEHLEIDDATKVIALFAEDLKDGKRFIDVARRMTRRKPIIVMKTGVSEQGARAVASHTGALAGSAKTYAAAFKQAGVLRAATSIEMLEMAKTHSLQSPLAGNRLAIVTNTGGLAAEMIDACDENGLSVPEFSGATQRRLREVIPPYCACRNPIDLGPPDPRQGEMFYQSARVALESGEVDAVIFLLVGLAVECGGSKLTEMSDELKGYGKGIATVALAEKSVTEKWTRALEDSGFPTFKESRMAARCVGSLWEYSRYLSRQQS